MPLQAPGLWRAWDGGTLWRTDEPVEIEGDEEEIGAEVADWSEFVSALRRIAPQTRSRWLDHAIRNPKAIVAITGQQ